MNINAALQAPLSEAIQTEYDRLTKIISQVPEECRQIKIIDGTGGAVSVADIIAYQIGWGNLLIEWYEAGLHGKLPIMPASIINTLLQSIEENNFAKIEEITLDDKIVYELIADPIELFTIFSAELILDTDQTKEKSEIYLNRLLAELNQNLTSLLSQLPH